MSLAKILGHSNIKMTERYAKLAQQHIVRTSNTVRETWESLNVRRQKVKYEITNVRVLYAREILTRFFAVAKLLKVLVARDGIEPPTPAFSGPPTESRKWFEIKRILLRIKGLR